MIDYPQELRAALNHVRQQQIERRRLDNLDRAARYRRENRELFRLLAQTQSRHGLESQVQQEKP